MPVRDRVFKISRNDRDYNDTHVSKKRTGTYGEQLAANFLLAKGYTILETNWHCAHGELDIVAQDGDALVFVEVKTRHSATTEEALIGITPRKRERLINSAHTYIAETGRSQADWRIDVIAVALPQSRPPVIDHVEDALGW